MAARVQPRLSRGSADSARSCAASPFVTATTEQCLLRSHHSLAEAMRTDDVARRYACAHVAALQATAAMLAVRTQPTPRRGQRNAWELLTRVAPELTEWAALFAAGAAKRSAAEAGLSRLISARDADDLVRDAEQFITLVERSLGAPARLAAW